MKLSAAFLATIATSHVTAQIKMLSKPKRSHLGILKNAKPYSSSHRRLEEEEDLAINATYSIQFSSCLDIKTYNPDLFDEDIITYVNSGKVVSAKSYVLFTACPDEEACDDTYIVDLSTYLSTVVEYKSEDKENYCEACEEVEDACTDDDGGGKLISRWNLSIGMPLLMSNVNTYFDCDNRIKDANYQLNVKPLKSPVINAWHTDATEMTMQMMVLKRTERKKELLNGLKILPNVEGLKADKMMTYYGMD